MGETLCRNGVVQGENLPLVVYVVVNKMMLGREALGVFSSPEKAQKYMDHFVSKIEYRCQIERSLVRGYYQPQNHVFAAHIYDRREDVHVLEGMYSELAQAQRAAGREGEIIEFEIDSTEEVQIFVNE
jgi:hypothetical protein